MSTQPISKIEDVFYRPINRHINRVVKVEQDDRETIKQELDEYVLTGSLEKHYLDILEGILDTEHNKTDETGIWISGFFGSGKSHFMKILGYVLEDRTLPDGRSAAEAFKPRARDETLKGTIDSISHKFNSEVLMFQIGSRTSRAGKDSITDVINREFNRQQGYAELPWVARLEADLEKEEQYEAFKDAIKANEGRSWEQVQQNAAFIEPIIEDALVESVESFDSRDARHAIQNVKDQPEITPASLAEKLVKHIEKIELEEKNKPRYFVFLDEISQFIGDDEQMLLELQSIAEEFGRQGMGKIWLGVTSQEKLEELVPGVLAKNLEESKVGDRFPHRHDLISDNLDTVVRDRILKKKGEAVSPLSDLYNESEGLLSARYKLNSSRRMQQIDEESFVACYPFLPYQLEVLPQIFAALRGRGSDDRLTGRERTLIDVTQSVFKEPHNLRKKPLGNLATLDLVFDEIVEDIDDNDQRTIADADPQNVDTELARRALKSLYLLQRLDWIPNTAENIATTLYTDIGNLSSLESKVEAVLEQLVEEGYVGESEEGYRFLQESERKLEDEIDSVKVGIGDIRRRSKEFVRDALKGANKIGYEGQTFDVSIEADGEKLSETGHIHLYAYSPVYQLKSEVDSRTLKTQSFDKTDTIYWIADDRNANSVENDIERIKKIEQIVREKRGQQLSTEEQEALDRKKEDLARLQRGVKKSIEDAFQSGILIYNGTDTQLKESGTKLERIITDPSRDAIKKVFTKLDDGLANVSNRNIEQIFGDLEGRSNPTVFDELDVVIQSDLNPEARIATEVSSEIKKREQSGEVPTGATLIEHFGNPPYGWSRDVVRLAGAVLFRNGSIMATYKERTYDSYLDDGSQEVFSQVSKFRDASFKERETVDPSTRNDAKQLLDILFDKKVKQTDQEVARGITDAAGEWIEQCKERESKLERSEFPLRGDLSRLQNILTDIRNKATSAGRINEFLTHENQLKNLIDTAKQVVEFDDSGRLDEYQTFQTFCTNEWKEFTKLAKSSEYVDISDDVNEAAARLESELQSEAIIQNWHEVETDYRSMADSYAQVYESLYETRHAKYNDATEEVRNYGRELETNDLTLALQPLANKMGESSISVSTSGRSHLNLDPSMEMLITHIEAVDVYKDQALRNVDERRPDDDETKHHRIDLDEFFDHIVIKTAEDLDAPVDHLRTHVSDLLDDDGDVEIRFK